jgi:hypothetical protein
VDAVPRGEPVDAGSGLVDDAREVVPSPEGTVTPNIAAVSGLEGTIQSTGSSPAAATRARTTVIDIAERAGLTRSTFFRHFQDKREVLFGGNTMAGLLAGRSLRRRRPPHRSRRRMNGRGRSSWTAQRSRRVSPRA